ncbi:hypothetical protein JTE90_015684 [Oedothorax gibbosus]|uniref:THAP domain-containing protein 9 n=1 Tax=Oedothorax gibbosus TaxID=931172 RepID=A0AAV6U2T5_9ARAC|nr:hypothetical protein JTE90_015684 [Oedothorax gibbosus]
MVDEMAIKKHVEWDSTKFSGYMDLSTDLDGDELPVAKEALVFMVNALNSHWKVPIGYFLINGLTVPERANLIKEALIYIHETGVDVVSLTFDGTSSNIASANELGAKIASDDTLVHFFPHPVTTDPIYMILDACHMLKLVRNCLASKGAILSHGGHNNNPTAKQFKSAYVRLLAHHQVMTSDSANCSILDNTIIVNIELSRNSYLKSINESDVQKDEQWSVVESSAQDHNYCQNSFRHNSQYS